MNRLILRLHDFRTQVLVILCILQASSKAFLKFLVDLQTLSYPTRRVHSPTFKISTSEKSLDHCQYPARPTPVRPPYFCANQAPVTMLSFSLNCPKHCGLSAIATTAFCTVLLVTSAGRLWSSLASNCRVHDIPKTEVGPELLVA